MIILLAKVVIAAVSAREVLNAFKDIAPSPEELFQEDGEDILQDITDQLDFNVSDEHDDRDHSDGELRVQDASGTEVVQVRDEGANAIEVQGGESARGVDVGELEQVDEVVLVESKSGNGGGREGSNEGTTSTQEIERCAQVTAVMPPKQEMSDQNASEVTETADRQVDSSDRGAAAPSSVQPPQNVPTTQRRSRRRPRRRSRRRLTSAWVLLRRPRSYFGLPDYDTKEERQRRMREAFVATSTRNSRIQQWLGGGFYY